MKTYNFFTLFFAFIAIFIFTSANVIFAQVATTNQDSVHIVIVKDINGVVTEIDTVIPVDKAQVFVSENNFDNSMQHREIEIVGVDVQIPDNFKEAVAIIETELSELGRELERVSFDLKENIEKSVDEISMSLEELPTYVEVETMPEGKIIVISKCNEINYDTIFYNENGVGIHAIYIDREGLRTQCEQTVEIMQHLSESSENKMDRLEDRMDCMENSFETESIEYHFIIRYEKNSDTVEVQTTITDLKNEDVELFKEKGYVTGTENNFLKLNDLNYYPNPTDGKFQISFTTDNNEPVNLRIFDLNGRIVYEEVIPNTGNSYSSFIDISAFSSGVYFLQLSQFDKIQTKKIIIQ